MIWGYRYFRKHPHKFLPSQSFHSHNLLERPTTWPSPVWPVRRPKIGRSLAKVWSTFNDAVLGWQGFKWNKTGSPRCSQCSKNFSLGEVFQKFFQLQCFIKIFEITNKKMAEEAIMNKQITHRPDHQLVSLFVQMSPPKLVPLQVFHSLSRGFHPKVGSKKLLPPWRWATGPMGTVCCSREVESSSSLFGEHAPLPKLPKQHGPAGPGGTSLKVEKGRHLLEQIFLETPWRETWAFLLFWRDFFSHISKTYKCMKVWKWKSRWLVSFSQWSWWRKGLVLVISVMIILSLVWFSSRNMIQEDLSLHRIKEVYL